jgi:glycosyltransferase involved in cell wall biosynthesis
MSDRPRALHIAPAMPARTGNGLAMRQGMFLDALSRHFDTHLVVIPVAGSADEPAALPEALGVRTTRLSVSGRQDTHFSLLARLVDPAARLAAFRSYGRSSLAANLSVPVLADLRAALGNDRYDLVHIGRSYLADGLQVVRGRATTLDIDEDEWTSYREMARILRGQGAAAADWAEAEADALSRLIGKSLESVDYSFVSNELEAGELRNRHPDIDVETVPNAVSVPGTPRRSDDGATLLFLGSFSYLPNVDAANWLVGSIWPLVRSRRADARLLLVGRNADRMRALEREPGVHLWSDVKNIEDAFAAATVFVAPLRAGAGTRLKILEAAAHAVPVVSTSLGVRGLPLVHGRELLVADDEKGFAEAVVEAMSDGIASGNRAASARSVVRRHFDVGTVTAELSRRLRDAAAGKPPER